MYICMVHSCEETEENVGKAGSTRMLKHKTRTVKKYFKDYSPKTLRRLEKQWDLFCPRRN